MRRLITLISAGRNRTIVIRRELPRTKNADWAVKPHHIERWRILLSASFRPVTCTVVLRCGRTSMTRPAIPCSVTAGAIIPKVPVENSPAPEKWCIPALTPFGRRCGEVLRGKDVHEVEQMKQMGLSVSAISEMTGYDRKTVRKYLLEPEAVPTYSRRAGQAGKLDPHKPYLQDRLTAGVMERAGVTAGDSPARLWRRLHDSEGLAAAATRGSQRRRRSPL